MKLTPILTAALTTGLTVGLGAIVPVQAATYYAGIASDGQTVRVDVNSIARASQRSVDFIYYLGDERIFAQAHCDTGSWTTFPENETHYPQSQATRRMVNFVCGNSQNPGRPASLQIARVIDPPSNVRAVPNGRVICVLDRYTKIQVFSPVGSWYRTNACGSVGYIHVSQIQF